jgi:sugar lactone lactonase YvrE
MTAKLLDDAGAILGEGPVWHQEEAALYWVDIKGHRLNRYAPGGAGARRWEFHDNLAWVVPRRAGGWLAGARHEIGELRLDPELRFTPRLTIEADKPGNRLNDAKADFDGSVWFGTMDDAEAQVAGAFYHLLPDFSLERVDEGWAIPNGPAVSPDGRYIYHTDSARRSVYRYAKRPGGGLAARELFIRFMEDDGYPDGMTVDAKGGLWIAHWGGGRVSRFTAEGVFDRALALPVSQVTSCCFGGPRLDRLFVTTAAIGLDEAQRQREPMAGGLFELDPGIEGLPCPGFAG